MMKKYSCLLAVLLSVFMFVNLKAQEFPLVKYVPAGTEYVISVDVAKLRTLPVWEGLRNDPDSSQKINDILQDYRINPERIDQFMFVGGGKNLRGALMKVNIPENELVDNFKKLGGNRYSEGMVGEKSVVFVSTDESIPSERRKIGFLYLTPDTVLATEDVYFNKFLAGMEEAKLVKPEVIIPQNDVVAWSYINTKSINKSRKKGNANDMADMAVSGVNNVFAELKFTGADNKGIDLTAEANCRDENAVMLLNMQLAGLMTLGNSFLFTDNPQLGEEWLKKFKFTPSGKKLLGKLAFDGAFAEKLSEHFKEVAAKHVAPPDPGAGQ